MSLAISVLFYVQPHLAWGWILKGIDTVIHYGPANDIDDYMQEVGRCGRDKTQQRHTIL